ncbi:adhesion G protein-coupled receptor E5 isoform X2 [Leptodactylus fuscus]|uniref:adhesion G protein-coupled receptor E5 isoform X2 n=1 Tax=Leptodactylus fuscus TaxID=238119 RepID=UPI003F4F2F6B
MPRYGNIGICLLTLFINGLIAQTNTTLICPIGTLPPNTTNCPNNENCTKTPSCNPGYKEVNGVCIDIVECSTKADVCEAHTYCRNTQGGYYCQCEKGFQKDNVTEFCPSKNKAENKCTDIDECRNSPDICGSNSVCTNTPGSYKCTCAKGFTNISNTCAVKCKYKDSREDCAAIDKPLQFQCKLNNFREKYKPFCTNVTSQNDPSLMELLEGLDNLIDEFSYENDADRLQKAGQLLKQVEPSVQIMALLSQKALSYRNQRETISIQVSLGSSDGGTLSVQGKNSAINLDSKTAAGNTGLALLGSIEYTNISHILEGADLLESESNKTRMKLISPVVSVFLGISNTSSLQEPVSIRMNVTAEQASRNLTCVFWSVSDNRWSSNGCVIVKGDNTEITCNCTHLTSFAILMLLEDYESWTLTLITQIGLSISIFCLVLAIITFCFSRSLRGTRNTIHTHLCISLFFANCIFLLGITAYNSKVACRIVAGLLHAFYLCSFCWMSLEGLELYRMLVTVFKTHLKKIYLLAVGYGTPAVIVTISAAIYYEGYGTDKYCWLSREKGFIWAFMGPVCVIILVNCGIFILTVWKLAEKMSSISPEQGKLKRIRTLTITSVAQLCILGTCWAFGFFMFSTATPFFVYAFTILNTLQGLQIFCLHCLMHKKVRAEYKMWLCALVHFKAPVYSEFSNTSNTHTNTKGKTSKESGL